MVSFMEAIFGSAMKRFSTISSSLIKEGGVQNDVDRYLREVMNFSPDDVQAIMSSTRVKHIHYCQSALTSIRSLRSESECQPARRPGRDKFANHDFVVVHLTATKSDGQHHNLFISAEMEGGGQGGCDSGIYINVLTAEEYLQLQANFLATCEGYSTLVPLDILTRRLSEGHDTHYHLLLNNCWKYAKAACKSVLLLLSEQPDVNDEHKRYFIDNAKAVLTVGFKGDELQWMYYGVYIIFKLGDYKLDPVDILADLDPLGSHERSGLLWICLDWVMMILEICILYVKDDLYFSLVHTLINFRESELLVLVQFFDFDSDWHSSSSLARLTLCYICIKFCRDPYVLVYTTPRLHLLALKVVFLDFLVFILQSYWIIRDWFITINWPFL